MELHIADKFSHKLPADIIENNSIRQVNEAAFSFVNPTPTSNPTLIHFSPEMLQTLGLSHADAETDSFLQVFSGNALYPNTKPYAMCYGGHQFGHWAGQLGDGRAINLFEVNYHNQQWAVQLKGAGPTPYSRSADGLAVLRSSIREYLCSEAMYHLGVPTTRALAIALTGDEVVRDMLYNGNPAYEKGAIVTRVAPSFIRFGNFQIFAAKKDFENLKKITDYTITEHFKEIETLDADGYELFFETIAERTLKMVIDWQRVGFVHGVMNTDNMSILGLTIDYGPYGWLENYDPTWTPNTTDAQNRRYRFGTQGNIALWNLLQLGNALYPLIKRTSGLEATLKNYNEAYNSAYIAMMYEKLGLKTDLKQDDVLIKDLEDILFESEMDMTLFFRNLNSFNTNNTQIFIDSLPTFSYANNFEPFTQKWAKWFERYSEVIINDNQDATKRVNSMNSVNPKYVLRNYMAQLAIDAADAGDYSIIAELFELLKQPYQEQPNMEKWFVKRPDWAKNKVGCSMLSCSS